MSGGGDSILSKLMAKPAPAANTEFSGSLNSMSFADVLQLLQVGRKTGYVELEMGGQKGEIGIQSGEVYQARIGTLTGEEVQAWLAEAGFGDITLEMSGTMGYFRGVKI